jgi:hypothetical protein
LNYKNRKLDGKILLSSEYYILIVIGSIDFAEKPLKVCWKTSHGEMQLGSCCGEIGLNYGQTIVKRCQTIVKRLF